MVSLKSSHLSRRTMSPLVVVEFVVEHVGTCTEFVVG